MSPQAAPRADSGQAGLAPNALTASLGRSRALVSTAPLERSGARSGNAFPLTRRFQEFVGDLYRLGGASRRRVACVVPAPPARRGAEYKGEREATPHHIPPLLLLYFRPNILFIHSKINPPGRGEAKGRKKCSLGALEVALGAY